MFNPRGYGQINQLATNHPWEAVALTIVSATTILTTLKLLAPDKWAISFALCWPFLILGFFQTLGRYRMIAGIATSKIASASQGFVELTGRIKSCGIETQTPYSAIPCIWYSYTVEKRILGRKIIQQKWMPESDSHFHSPLCVEDDSGDTVFLLPQKMNRHLWPTLSKIERSPFGLGSEYRHTETYLCAGDPVFLNGRLTSCNKTGLSAAAHLIGNLKDKESIKDLQKTIHFMVEHLEAQAPAHFKESINLLTPCKNFGGLLSYGQEKDVLRLKKRTLCVKALICLIHTALVGYQIGTLSF